MKRWDNLIVLPQGGIRTALAKSRFRDLFTKGVGRRKHGAVRDAALEDDGGVIDAFPVRDFISRPLIVIERPQPNRHQYLLLLAIQTDRIKVLVCSHCPIPSKLPRNFKHGRSSYEPLKISHINIHPDFEDNWYWSWNFFTIKCRTWKRTKISNQSVTC